MAVLPDVDRATVWQRLMERGLVPAGVDKAEFRAAVDAIDDVYDSQAATWNTALPQPYRGAATAAQKYELFALIGLQRAKVKP
jgi:hypothetical protein